MSLGRLEALCNDTTTATHCKTLQHTTTHCNTLQHTAAHGIFGSAQGPTEDKRTATRCNTLLQNFATHCNPLQPTATHCSPLQPTAAHCNTLQQIAPLDTKSSALSEQISQYVLCKHTATHCNTLQHTAIHCKTLKYIATHWKTR